MLYLYSRQEDIYIFGEPAVFIISQMAFHLEGLFGCLIFLVSNLYELKRKQFWNLVPSNASIENIDLCFKKSFQGKD